MHRLQKCQIAHAELVLHVVTHRQLAPDDRQRRPVRIPRRFVLAEKHQRLEAIQMMSAISPAAMKNATPRMMMKMPIAAPAIDPRLRGGLLRSRCRISEFRLMTFSSNSQSKIVPAIGIEPRSMSRRT